MRVITDTMRTQDGQKPQVLSTNLAGDYPIAIYIAETDTIARLTSELICHTAPSYTLSEPRKQATRFFNVYRANDGSFTFGTKPFLTEGDRLETEDSKRSLFGLKITIDETNRVVESSICENPADHEG